MRDIKWDATKWLTFLLKVVKIGAIVYFLLYFVPAWSDIVGWRFVEGDMSGTMGMILIVIALLAITTIKDEIKS